jgi:hypothetical protein
LAERIPTAGDPTSCANLFWEALTRGDRREALNAVSRISLPPVCESYFPFSEEGADEQTSPDVEEVEEGALLLTIPVET